MANPPRYHPTCADYEMDWLMREMAGDSMRILMSLYNQVGRGTYWRALSLARGLTARGHDVDLLAISTENRFSSIVKMDKGSSATIIETADLLWGSLRSGWDPWDVLGRLNWIRSHSYDLVHSFESRPVALFPALFAESRYDIPLVMDWCDWFGKGGSVEERPNGLIRAALRPVETFFEDNYRTRAKSTTVINSFLKKRAEDLGVDETTISILPNGCNIDELNPVSKEAAREKTGLDSNDFILGYIGAIFKRDAVLLAKTFDIATEAVSGLRLIIVGYCNYDIRSMVNQPDAVIATGRVPYEKINQYLGACDLCILPLNDSGANRGRFPLKLNDYMAVGRPVLATEVGEIGEFVCENQIGWLASPSPEDLAEKIESISKLPEEQISAGNRARQLAESHYSWDKMSNTLEGIYKKNLE